MFKQEVVCRGISSTEQKLRMLSALINKDHPNGDLSSTKKYQTVSLW